LGMLVIRPRIPIISRFSAANLALFMRFLDIYERSDQGRLRRVSQ
jgi:hypothetical protein